MNSAMDVIVELFRALHWSSDDGDRGMIQRVV